MTMGLAGGIALMMGVAGMVTAAPVRAQIFQSNAVMSKGSGRVGGLGNGTTADRTCTATSPGCPIL